MVYQGMPKQEAIPKHKILKGNLIKLNKKKHVFDCKFFPNAFNVEIWVCIFICRGKQTPSPPIVKTLSFSIEV